jgi:hypothetical protein
MIRHNVGAKEADMQKTCYLVADLPHLIFILISSTKRWHFR